MVTGAKVAGDAVSTGTGLRYNAELRWESLTGGVVGGGPMSHFIMGGEGGIHILPITNICNCFRKHDGLCLAFIQERTRQDLKSNEHHALDSEMIALLCSVCIMLNL